MKIIDFLQHILTSHVKSFSLFFCLHILLGYELIKVPCLGVEKACPEKKFWKRDHHRMLGVMFSGRLKTFLILYINYIRVEDLKVML